MEAGNRHVRIEPSPTLVTEVERADSMSLGWAAGAIVTHDEEATAECWGDNEFGQLGVDMDHASSPVEIPVDDVVDVATGPRHTCVLDASDDEASVRNFRREL
ncbi:MAG: hypothetical protein ACOCUS_02885, partial [Polyangiales bacterium]